MPKADGAQFCATCGTRLDEPRMCPTCGQHWSGNSPMQPESHVQSQAPATLAPPKVAKGIYTSAQGTVFFDGIKAWVAVDRGGFFLPDLTQEVAGFAHDAAGTILVLEHEEESSDRPTGPVLGPDYVPGRDCGNCGFELVGDTSSCSRCGSTNTGPVFDPRLSS